MRKFSSGTIQNKVLTINSEHLSSEDHFERKFQDKISPYDQIFEKKEEELIEFKEKNHDTLRKSSSGSIKNGVLTITSALPYSVDNFEGLLQDKISPLDNFFENQEEELIKFKEEHHDELRKFSSGSIQNKVLTIKPEHPSYEDQFERKLQDKISPSDQFLEQLYEELIEFKG